jgi:hypothetical protein
MNAYKCLLAAAIAAVGLASAASACEAHHPANGTEQTALDVRGAPSDLPRALGERGLQTLRVDLETVEAASKLEDGPSYNQQPPAKE